MADPPPHNPAPGTDNGHLSPDVLSAYIDDQLSPAERESAARHLAACTACQHELAELRATVRLLHGLPQVRPHRSFTLDPAQTEAVRYPPETSRFGRLLPVLRVATVVVAVLLVAVVAGDLIDHSGQNGGQQAAAPNVGAPAFEQIAGTKPAATTSHQRSAVMPAATHPPVASSEQAPAAAAPAQTPPAVFGARAPSVTPTATPPATAPATPTATATSPATATTGGSGSGTIGTSHQDRPSGWRIAEIALGLLLVWLAVSWIGLVRLRNRDRETE